MRDITKVIDRLVELVEPRTNTLTDMFRLLLNQIRDDVRYLPPERVNEAWMALYQAFNQYVSRDPKELDSIDYDIISEFTTIVRDQVQQVVEQAWQQKTPFVVGSPVKYRANRPYGNLAGIVDFLIGGNTTVVHGSQRRFTRKVYNLPAVASHESDHHWQVQIATNNPSGCFADTPIFNPYAPFPATK